MKAVAFDTRSPAGLKPNYFIRKLAFQRYLEGLEFRSIGSFLEVSNVTVLDWIRAFGEQIEDLKSAEPMVYAEMDEMHTYVGQKNYRWI